MVSLIKADAVSLGAVFSDGLSATCVGEHLTCGEAEELCEGLYRLGLKHQAAFFLAAHATSDEEIEDDWHLELKSSGDALAYLRKLVEGPSAA